MKINELHPPSIWALADLHETPGERERQKYSEDLGRFILNRISERKIEAEKRWNLRSTA